MAKSHSIACGGCWRPGPAHCTKAKGAVWFIWTREPKAQSGKRWKLSPLAKPEGRLAFFRNPVTGKEQRVSILLHTGLLAKREDHFSAKTFNVKADRLEFQYPGRNALAFTNVWRGLGED